MPFRAITRSIHPQVFNILDIFFMVDLYFRMRLFLPDQPLRIKTAGNRSSLSTGPASFLSFPSSPFRAALFRSSHSPLCPPCVCLSAFVCTIPQTAIHGKSPC